MAGRSVLAKASLASIPSHLMQYITFPSKTTNIIDRIQRNFPWGTTSEKKMHLVGWNTFTKPKHHGGLSLQKCDTKNKALHAGLAWRMFHNPQALWTKVLYHKYCHNRTPPPKKPIVSRTWQNIRKGWDTCSKGYIWIVNKGDRVSFFTDKWIPNHDAIRSHIHGPLKAHEQNLKVNSLMWNGSWNLRDLLFTFPAEPERIITDSFLPTPNSLGDNLIWDLTRNGVFTVMSAYRLIDGEGGEQPNNMDMTWIWRTQAPNKIKTFMCLLFHGRLPTNHHLHTIVNPTCRFCERHNETIDHIFFHCTNATTL